MLPFGLRSAPKIFSAVANALQWILQAEGLPHVEHYLDDFAIVGPPLSPACSHDLETLCAVCARLRVPLAPEKMMGPATCLPFLGIEIDTQAALMRVVLVHI